jgi:hypothetical protein
MCSFIEYGIGTSLESSIKQTFSQLVIPLFDVACPDLFFSSYRFMFHRELEAAKGNPEQWAHLVSVLLRHMFVKGSKTDLEYDSNRIHFCLSLLTAKRIPEALLLRFITKLMIHLRVDSLIEVQISFLEMLNIHFSTLTMRPFSVQDETVRLKVLTVITDQLLKWAVGEDNTELLATLVEALDKWVQIRSVNRLMKENPALLRLLELLVNKNSSANTKQV